MDIAEVDRLNKVNIVDIVDMLIMVDTGHGPCLKGDMEEKVVEANYANEVDMIYNVDM